MPSWWEDTLLPGSAPPVVGVTGWWAEIHTAFALEVFPSFGFVSGGATSAGAFGLSLAPEIGMAAVGTSLASFGLQVFPMVGMSSPDSLPLTLYPSESRFPSGSVFPTAPEPGEGQFGLMFNPSLGFAAGARYSAAFGLQLDPQVGMSAGERYGAAFGVELDPSLGFAAAEKYAKAFGLTVSPAIGMDASERYAAAFDLTVTPGIGMGVPRAYDFGIEVVPEIGMDGGARYARSFGVEVSPGVGFSAKAVGNAAFGLQVTPVVGMAGDGNNGVTPVAFGALAAGTDFAFGTGSWTHTAAAGSYVIVDVTMGGNSAVTSVSYGGVAMTLLGERAYNNTASQGWLRRYGLAGVAGGAQTIEIVKGGFNWSVAASISVVNVGSVGATTAAHGNGASLSQGPVTNPSGGMVVQSFSKNGAPGNTAFTTVSGGTNRVNRSGGGANSMALAISTADATATFGATVPDPVNWSGLATVFNPA